MAVWKLERTSVILSTSHLSTYSFIVNAFTVCASLKNWCALKLRKPMEILARKLTREKIKMKFLDNREIVVDVEKKRQRKCNQEK